MCAKQRPQLVVCDASPLIFLAKVDQLSLIQKLFTGRCVVLDCVASEVLSPQADPVEMERLRNWLQGVERVNYQGSLFASNALSQSDQSSLAWAVENKATTLIADERLLRRFAKEHTIGVIGFCGLILAAVTKQHLSRAAARKHIDAAVSQHGLRLSIKVYQAILVRLSL